MPLIVIEGTDGSGKGTQTRLLVERLKAEGKEVETLDFPQYESPSSWFVQQYLNGKFGSIKDVTAKQASLFYALDRYAIKDKLKGWLKEGKTVIANRYTTANMGHQTAKVEEGEREAFITWLKEIEYTILGLPEPDQVFFLYVPSKLNQELVDKKQASEREYAGGKKRDLHEADQSHLSEAEKAFLWLAEKEGWTTVQCAPDGSMRSIEDIHKEIKEKIKL